ncbi:hypothetical protein HHK36_008104 [Tetracentron sinense]|uniref:Uncharacterized protein n=1 Tax=Tetracentron sinense TaxID=13715 RepID=A0A835DN36_TETSI|nr:hypothetical protein HHK36_008104 [Tetracentron sinense]
MATLTDDSSSNHLQMESIPLVDLRFLSQPELHSLTLCSDTAFDLRRCNDIVIPKIDRSVFNESAGSRKQTYSRLRLAPRKPEIASIGRRRRCGGLLPLLKPPANAIDDPERKENKRIVSLLTDLFPKENPVTALIPTGEIGQLFLEPLNVNVESKAPVVLNDGGMKRKRGRKPKIKVEGDGREMSKAIVVYGDGSNLENRALEIVNKNGVVIDVTALANLEDPFGPELKRRTVGLETEAELLGFLKELSGQWASNRKKRKIVEASDFGDELPKGWKLLLNLKRKEGRVWLNCGRYISPSGQQFVTCKEVSSYLLSSFRLQDASQPNSGHGNENIQQAYKLASRSTAGLTHKDDNRGENFICCSASPITSTSIDHEMQVSLLGTENLAEVQVRDLIQCQKCNMNFDEKDAYLQHLLSTHQRMAKRCRLGTPIGDGVIIKDGKYECQFCHKIFHERQRYNGHVGVHVRNYVRSVEALPGEVTVQKSIGPTFQGGVPSRVFKMDASVDTCKDSIPKCSSAKPIDGLDAGSHSKMDADSISEIPTAKSIHENSFVSPHSEWGMEANRIDKTLINNLCDKHDSHCKIGLERIDKACSIVAVKLNSCLDFATTLSNNKEKSASETSAGKDILTSTTDESDKSLTEQEKVSPNCSFTPSGNGQICGLEDDVNEVFTSTTEEPKLDEVGNYGNIELKVGFGSSHTGPDKDVLTETIGRADEANVLHIGVAVSSLPTAEPKLDEVEKSGNSEPKIGFDRSHSGPDKDFVTETVGRTDKETVLQSDVTDSSPPLVQSSVCFPTFNMISDKGDDEFYGTSQKFDNISGFEELSFVDIEAPKFGFVTGKDLSSLPEESIDLVYEAELEQGFDSSISFEWETVLPKMASRHQLTTVCVWCRIEFHHEPVNSEILSDSAGFMCPACRAKISGKLNV